ncbi:hypothetical protein D3C76_1807730 [compost metagenome]
MRAFIIVAVRGIDGLGHPIDGDVGDEQLFAEMLQYVVIFGGCPIMPFFKNESGQCHRRIMQAVGCRLRFCT